MRCMIESAISVFQETTADFCIAAMFETKVVSSNVADIRKAAKGEKTPIHQAVEQIIRRVIARVAANKAIHMKVDSPAALQEFVQHFTSHVFNISTVTLPLNYMLKQ